MAAYGSKVLRVHDPRLAPDSPHRFARDEDVPRELALTVAANQTFDSQTLFGLYILPWVAKLASPELLYCDDEIERALRLPRDPATEMIKVYERQNLGAAEEPVKHEAPKQGRNEACACGSNKKFKKCCGG